MLALKKIALAMSAMACAVPAFAGPGAWSTMVVYYADTAKTSVVGREYDTCPTAEHESETILVGERSDYYDVFSGSCP